MEGSRKRELLVTAALVAGAVAAAALGRRRHRPVRAVPGDTRRVANLYDREAARYDSMIRIPERLLLSNGRRWAASAARGDVLEIAVGTGRNVRHYGPDVRMTGQDISAAMLDIARGRGQALGREMGLSVSDAQTLPFADEQFDSVVSTLALCTIPDERRALAEAYRVLRPGGRLILLEHVRSPQPFVRALQRLLEPLANRVAGDHLLRDPVDHLSRLGFSLDYCVRSRAGMVERVVAHKKPGYPTTGKNDDA